MASEVINLITSHKSGEGLAGLLRQFEQQGLGSVVQSWVGTGPNQAVSLEQIRNVLGSEQIQQLAARAGLDPDQIAGALAQLLPLIIDQLTPTGQVPQTGDLRESIGRLLQKFGISGAP